MREFQVKLSSFDEVRQFVSLTTRQSYPIHVAVGDDLTNAKSLIGFFTMDLSKPVSVRIEDDQADITPFLTAIAPFRV